MGSMRKKPYRRKILSIESSELYVWLVWILTTISVRLLARVENKSEEGFS
jgi:hypothetical protein